MSVAEEMRRRLERVFAPERLEIVDESDRHIGHAGYQEGGQSHWRITLKSKAFTGQSRIERHRAVHRALGDDIVGRIHALALNLSD